MLWRALAAGAASLSTKPFPRYEFLRPGPDCQGPGSLGQLRVPGEEGLDLPCAGHAQAWDRRPPAPPARHPQGQVRQCPDACCTKGRGQAWR